MFWTSFLGAALVLQGSHATPTPRIAKSHAVQRNDIKYTLKDVEKRSTATPLEVTENVLTLKSIGQAPKGSSGTPPYSRHKQH